LTKIEFKFFLEASCLHQDLDQEKTAGHPGLKLFSRPSWPGQNLGKKRIAGLPGPALEIWPHWSVLDWFV